MNSLLGAGLAAVPANRVVFFWELARTEFFGDTLRLSGDRKGALPAAAGGMPG